MLIGLILSHSLSLSVMVSKGNSTKVFVMSLHMVKYQKTHPLISLFLSPLSLPLPLSLSL